MSGFGLILLSSVKYVTLAQPTSVSMLDPFSMVVTSQEGVPFTPGMILISDWSGAPLCRRTILPLSHRS